MQHRVADMPESPKQYNIDKVDVVMMNNYGIRIPKKPLRWFKRFLLCITFLLLLTAVLSYFSLTGPFWFMEQNIDKIVTKQKEIDYMAKHLKVEYIQYGDSWSIRLHNKGHVNIQNGNWEIYFSQVTPFLDGDKHDLHLEPVNGFLFRITPNKGKGISVAIPSQSFIDVQKKFQLKSKYYVFPNWLVTAPNLAARIIQSTNFTDPEQIISMSPTYSSGARYKANAVILSKEKLNPKLVIPSPAIVEDNGKGEELVEITNEWMVGFSSHKIASEAEILSDFLNIKSRHFASLTEIIEKSTVIYLNLDSSSKKFENYKGEHSNEESYELVVSHKGVVVTSETTAGIFYGVQSLISLSLNRYSQNEKGFYLPVMTIRDFPRYPYRGLHIDVARHFLGKSFIMKMITVMSWYKLNSLHLHLTDDEGWRIEIPCFPELTEVGAQPVIKHEKKTKVDFLHPFLGQLETNSFYSVGDYKDILKHARKHHVAVIPELDFPGHSHAALVSMRARKSLKNSRSREMKLKECALPENLVIEDEEDQSNDASVNGLKDTVINICLNSTFHFIKILVSTMIDLHKDIQPLKVIHLGGDEVSKTALQESPVCQKFIEQNKIDDLQIYARKRIADIGSNFGLKIIFWESEGMDVNLKTLKSAIVQQWLQLKDREKEIQRYLSAGIELILSEADMFYLDHPSEPCTLERGFRWATSFIDEHKIFAFKLPSLCPPLDSSCDVNARKKLIRGMEAHLWGELILREEDAENMLFPRLLAFAERAWHEAEWEKPDDNISKLRLKDDFSSFIVSVDEKELPRLDQFGVIYRVPPPGAIRSSDVEIKYNAIFPSLQIQGSLDDGETWKPVEEIKTFDNLILSTLSADGKRRSRSVSLK